MSQYRYFEIGEHTAILGCTGSGKTQYAGYQIAKSPFHLFPLYIIDYKGDTLINSISRAKEIGLQENLSRHPGIYIVKARPDQEKEVEGFLENLWHHENAILYVDETYLAPDKKWLRNLLAQGRSKNISVIAASQRPFDIPRSIFTEASHITVFRLNDKDDLKRVRQFTPEGMLENRLPDFHSYWYGVKDHKADDPTPYAVIGPVPGADVIVNRIDDRLAPKVRTT